MKIRSKIIKSILIFACLVIVLLIAFTIFFDTSDITSSLSPTSVELDSTVYKPGLSDSIRSLTIENIFWTNRLRMAEDKSIDLLIDLVIKKVMLELHGVIIFSTPIYNYTYNSALEYLLGDQQFYNWLRMRFVLEQEWASIAKEPIQIREIGPRANGENILTHFRNPEDEKEIYINLDFSNMLSITLKQVETDLDSLDFLKIPFVHSKYQLEIYLSYSAAQTIYRAIQTGQTTVALRTE